VLLRKSDIDDKASVDGAKYMYTSVKIIVKIQMQLWLFGSLEPAEVGP